jgi:serine/threonine protein kinase
MGTVYRAEQIRLKRIVAIKFLHPSRQLPRSSPEIPVPAPHSRSPATLPSAALESQVLAQVAHPHIVTVFDSGVVDGREYLVLEYLPNGSLRERLQGSPWRPGRALPVLKAVAEALTAIHLKGLLHLDLKPENVLYNEHGQVKLTDFGLARTQVDAGTLSELGMVPGSLDYAPLEQRSGLPVDPRADLFSLAVIAYEMLTGRLPGRVYRPASQLNPVLHPAVDEVLRKGLARHPEDRPASVSEFQLALTAALKRWRGPSRRTLLLLLGSTGLAGLATVGWYLWPRSPAAPPGSRTQMMPLLRGNSVTWLVDSGDGEPWLGERRPEQFRNSQGQRIHVQVVQEDSPPALLRGSLIPSWPAPRPLLLFDNRDHQVFFHPLLDPSLGLALFQHWPHTFDRPEFAHPVNRLQMGSFDGDCLGVGKPWEVTPEQARHWLRGDSVRVATPDSPDRPGRGLCLVKASCEAGREVGCQQRVTGLKLTPGTRLALRYKAWLGDGHGRLSVAPSLGLSIPVGVSSPESIHLRRLAIPLADGVLFQMSSFSYRLSDWITPLGQPRNYWTLWEWPSFVEEDELTIEIVFDGLGRAWVTDVELFTWEIPPAADPGD